MSRAPFIGGFQNWERTIFRCPIEIVAPVAQILFEARVSITAMPDRDLYRHVEDQGLTGIVHWPFKYTLGPTSSIEQERSAMERYAEDIIVPLSTGH